MNIIQAAAVIKLVRNPNTFLTKISDIISCFDFNSWLSRQCKLTRFTHFNNIKHPNSRPTTCFNFI